VLLGVCALYAALRDARSKEQWVGEFRAQLVRLGRTLAEAQQTFGQGQGTAAGRMTLRWLERIGKAVGDAGEAVREVDAQGLCCDLVCGGKQRLLDARDKVLALMEDGTFDEIVQVISGGVICCRQ